MDNPILPSTAFLTVLLAIGLFFFIRASTKDRIEVNQLLADQPQESLLEALQGYFSDRAYRITAVDEQTGQVTYEGFVSPSLFLAVFLSLLAAVGFLCLALVLAMLVPAIASGAIGLVALAPLAGVFYWKRSARPETVYLKVETVALDAPSDRPTRSLVTVTGHRDELAELQRSLKLSLVESD
jgi:hypothetical protein